MACPTCDHTMEGCGHGIFHCPRCGTIKLFDGSTDVPTLVRRCRAFGSMLAEHNHASYYTRLHEAWAHYGIAEAINKPADRPKPQE